MSNANYQVLNFHLRLVLIILSTSDKLADLATYVGFKGEQVLQKVHNLRQTTFGLESYVETVEALVTSAGSDGAPKYVGVWGMGGVGKTHLLKTLYERAQVHDHMKRVTFIRLTVGKSPDIMALYRSLSKELGHKPKLDLNELDYKDKLEKLFAQKRVFLVLDDLWEKQTFGSLDLAKGKGSVTLLSSRNQALFNIASPEINEVHMTPLSKEHSWSPFCVHAVRPPSDVPCELEGVAQSMDEYHLKIAMGFF
jgi:hypothetical protein